MAQPSDDSLRPYRLQTPPLRPLLSSQAGVVADFYPPSLAPEDEHLSESTVQKGYVARPIVQTEAFSAHEHISKQLRNGPILSNLPNVLTTINRRCRRRYSPIKEPTLKLPSRVTLNEQKREAWVSDLANPKVSLSKLARSVPHGYRGEKLVDMLVAKEVPVTRSVWYIRVLGAHEIRGRSTSRARQHTHEWTNILSDYVRKLMSEVVLPVTLAPRAGMSVRTKSKGTFSDRDQRKQWATRFGYMCRLIKRLATEDLIDRPVFLALICDQCAHSNAAQFPFLKYLACDVLPYAGGDTLRSLTNTEGHTRRLPELSDPRGRTGRATQATISEGFAGSLESLPEYLLELSLARLESLDRSLDEKAPLQRLQNTFFGHSTSGFLGRLELLFAWASSQGRDGVCNVYMAANLLKHHASHASLKQQDVDEVLGQWIDRQEIPWTESQSAVTLDLFLELAYHGLWSVETYHRLSIARGCAGLVTENEVQSLRGLLLGNRSLFDWSMTKLTQSRVQDEALRANPELQTALNMMPDRIPHIAIIGDGKLAERSDTQAAALAGYKETKTYIMSLPRRSSQLQCIRFLVLPAVDALLSTPARSDALESVASLSLLDFRAVCDLIAEVGDFRSLLSILLKSARSVRSPVAAASVSSVMKSLHGVWQAMQADDAIKASIHDMSARLNTKPALQVVDSLPAEDFPVVSQHSDRTTSSQMQAGFDFEPVRSEGKPSTQTSPRSTETVVAALLDVLFQIAPTPSTDPRRGSLQRVFTLGVGALRAVQKDHELEFERSIRTWFRSRCQSPESPLCSSTSTEFCVRTLELCSVDLISLPPLLQECVLPLWHAIVPTDSLHPTNELILQHLVHGSVVLLTAHRLDKNIAVHEASLWLPVASRTLRTPEGFADLLRLLSILSQAETTTQGDLVNLIATARSLIARTYFDRVAIAQLSRWGLIKPPYQSLFAPLLPQRLDVLSQKAAIEELLANLAVTSEDFCDFGRFLGGASFPALHVQEVQLHLQYRLVATSTTEASAGEELLQAAISTVSQGLQGWHVLHKLIGSFDQSVLWGIWASTLASITGLLEGMQPGYTHDDGRARLRRFVVFAERLAKILGIDPPPPISDRVRDSLSSCRNAWSMAASTFCKAEGAALRGLWERVCVVQDLVWAFELLLHARKKGFKFALPANTLATFLCLIVVVNDSPVYSNLYGPILEDVLAALTGENLKDVFLQTEPKISMATVVEDPQSARNLHAFSSVMSHGKAPGVNAWETLKAGSELPPVSDAMNAGPVDLRLLSAKVVRPLTRPGQAEGDVSAERRNLWADSMRSTISRGGRPARMELDQAESWITD